MEISLLNRQRFRDAIQDYVTISKKSMGQAINNALGDIAMTAIRTTYKTNIAKIEAELTRAQSSGNVYETRRGFRQSAMRKDSYRDWETDRKSTRLNSSHRL